MGRGGGERPGEAVGRVKTGGGALSRGGRLRKRRRRDRGAVMGREEDEAPWLCWTARVEEGGVVVAAVAWPSAGGGGRLGSGSELGQKPSGLGALG
jgi:hypothetical protein